MIKKRLFALIAIVAIASTLLPAATFATDSLARTNKYAMNGKIEISSVEAVTGDEVPVEIKIVDNPGVTTISFRVNYDRDNIILVKQTNGPLLNGQITSQEYSNYPYYCGWINSLQKDNCTLNGTLITLFFKVKEGTPSGSYNISVTDGVIDAYDTDLRSKVFNITNGSVIVKSQDNQHSDSSIENDETLGNNNEQAIIIHKVESSKIFITSKKYNKKTARFLLRFKASMKDLDGYRIYRSNKKNFGYKRIVTISKYYWTDSKIKKNHTYYYKIRGYKVIDGKKYFTKHSYKIKLNAK